MPQNSPTSSAGDDRSVIDVVERTLGTTLEDWSRSGLRMTPDLFLELNSNVRAHYKANKIPEKPLDELRPGLFAGYNVGFRYADDDAFLALTTKIVHAETHELKRLLLYSDRVVVPDPLLFWRPAMAEHGSSEDAHGPRQTLHDLAGRLAPIVNRELGRPQPPDLAYTELLWDSALLFYSQYKNLIRRHYVLPVDGHSMLTAPTLDLQELIDINEPLRKIFVGQTIFRSFTDFATYATHAMQQLAHRERFGGRIDPFFVAPEICDAYALVLRRALSMIQGKNRRQYLTNAYLGSEGSIDGSKLTEEDVLRMRENEELFSTWRTIVQDVLRELYRGEPKDDLSDRGADVDRLLKQQRRQWQAEFTRLVGRSSVLEGVLDKTAVSLGIMTGAVAAYGGAGSAEILAAAGAGGVLAPLLNLLFNAIARGGAAPRRRSLDHHFMALGEKGP